jgi:hypothetical protein
MLLTFCYGSPRILMWTSPICICTYVPHYTASLLTITWCSYSLPIIWKHRLVDKSRHLTLKLFFSQNVTDHENNFPPEIWHSWTCTWRVSDHGQAIVPHSILTLWNTSIHFRISLQDSNLLLMILSVQPSSSYFLSCCLFCPFIFYFLYIS